jgi:hypothetical protein
MQIVPVVHSAQQLLGDQLAILAAFIQFPQDQFHKGDSGAALNLVDFRKNRFWHAAFGEQRTNAIFVPDHISDRHC